MSGRLTVDDDALLDRLEAAIDAIIALDVPDLPPATRQILAGHLTGAVYVTIREAADAT